MIRGTRYLLGKEVEKYNLIINVCKEILINNGFSEIIVPSLWEQETFIKKSGNEIINQMYIFKDKKERDICLIPEVTAIIQEIYNNSWKKQCQNLLNYFIFRDVIDMKDHKREDIGNLHN